MIHQNLITYYAGLDDRTLWRAFLEGEKPAFEWIYRKHAQGLFSYGMKISQSPSMVKDCIQELFVELWNRRNFLSTTDNIKFYLFKALKIKISHALHDEKRTRIPNTVNERRLYEAELSYEETLIEDQMALEKKNKLVDALNRLPERQREILNLLFFEDMSYEQVSEIMSINVSSAYTLAWKGVCRLKKLFREILFLIALLAS